MASPPINTAPMPDLELDAIALARGGRLLMQDLSLRLGPGESAVVRGPNGAGKTTLLRAVAGLNRPESGRITYGDQPTYRLPPDRRAEVWYQSHQLALKTELSPAENLRFWSALQPKPVPVMPLLERVGIASLADRPVGTLSAGQRRRTGLARLLLGLGGLWLLDEPLTNLDSDGAQIVASLLNDHREQGGIALIATHQEVPAFEIQFEVLL